MADSNGNKLVLAVLQGDDYDNTVQELNAAGFFVTLLSSTGGFLKKKSTTVMIGVEKAQLQQLLDILKRCAGKRVETVYQNVTLPHAGGMTAIPPIPVDRLLGGAAVFVMDLERIEKF